MLDERQLHLVGLQMYSDNTTTTLYMPIGTLLKSTVGAGYTITKDTSSRGFSFTDTNGNQIQPPNWSESLGYAGSDLDPGGVQFGKDIDTYIANTFNGQTIGALPSSIGIPIPVNDIPTTPAPFGTIIPGVPNWGVNPQTGATPINSAIDLTTQLGGIFGWFTDPMHLVEGGAFLGGVVLIFMGARKLQDA